MAKSKALIIGQSVCLMHSLPSLLFRANFDVDAITSCAILQKSKFISNCHLLVDANSIIEKVAEQNLDNYALIIICDDDTLKLITSSNISLENKLKILPVKNPQNLQHLYSKIDLSLVLAQANVATPDFIVANGLDQTIKAAEKLTYPVMVKINSSNGGRGVFECNNVGDIVAIEPQLFSWPLLVQKKINGTELDLSAFYQDEKLIHFSYSTFKKVVGNKFGPSSVKIYSQLGDIDEQVFLEVSNLGKALGANGFVTISCIESSEDNRRYFIEADMRPNAWVEFPKFIGDDPAKAISNWFKNSETLKYPYPINKKYPTQMLMSYFLRLSASELLKNRYKVWKFLPFKDNKLLADLLYTKLTNENKTAAMLINSFLNPKTTIRRFYRHPKLFLVPVNIFFLLPLKQVLRGNYLYNKNGKYFKFFTLEIK